MGFPENTHDTCDEQIDRITAERDALAYALSDYLHVRENSNGVVGWHKNGDVAEWAEFDIRDDIAPCAAALARHAAEQAVIQAARYLADDPNGTEQTIRQNISMLIHRICQLDAAGKEMKP